jgi:rod shape-determining protein MreC
MSKTDFLQGKSVLHSGQTIAAKGFETKARVENYFHLKKVNDSLALENQRLHERLALLEQSFDTIQTNYKLHEIQLNDSTLLKRYAQFKYISCKVINNSTSQTNNFITINIGSNQGVKNNMALVSDQGVVGKIVETGANYAVALSVMSEIQPISVQWKDKFSGIAKWYHTKRQYFILKDVPQTHKIKIGDTITTTNYSFFPKNVIVGYVEQVFLSKSTGNKVVYIKPSNNFSALNHVFVVDNLNKQAQQAVEDKAKEMIKK